MAFRSVPRPSSPPGAKASTECPSYAREFSQYIPRDVLNAPCTETIPTRPPTWVEPSISNRPSPLEGGEPGEFRAQPITQHYTQQYVPPSRVTRIANASEHKLRRSRVATHSLHERLPVRQHDPTIRPETHQNLIHNLKNTQTTPRSRETLDWTHNGHAAPPSPGG